MKKMIFFSLLFLMFSSCINKNPEQREEQVYQEGRDASTGSGSGGGDLERREESLNTE